LAFVIKKMGNKKIKKLSSGENKNNGRKEWKISRLTSRRGRGNGRKE